MDERNENVIRQTGGREPIEGETRTIRGRGFDLDNDLRTCPNPTSRGLMSFQASWGNQD